MEDLKINKISSDNLHGKRQEIIVTKKQQLCCNRIITTFKIDMFSMLFILIKLK